MLEELSDSEYDALKVFPMSQFPSDMRARINTQANCVEPPSKWLRLELGEIPSRGWFEWHIRRGRDPRKQRTGTPQSLRIAVLKRDGMNCGICGLPIAVGEKIHIDHKVPVRHGGKTVLDNLQVAHAVCNLAKGASLE